MLIPFPDPFTLQAKIKDARHTSSMHLFAPEGLDVFLERVSSTPLHICHGVAFSYTRDQ